MYYATSHSYEKGTCKREIITPRPTSPVPLQVEHLEYVVPGSARFPSHRLQITRILVVMSLLQPFAASMKDRLITC